MTQTFVVQGFTFSVASVVAALAVLQFVVVLMSGGKRAVLVSALIFAGAFLAIFSTNRTHVAQAAIVSTKQHGSCSSITEEMSAGDVKTKVGEPDETRSEEETRGPGAAMWIYRDSRCAVHILDDKVEFID